MSKDTISIIMGSQSDSETVKQAINLLKEFRVNFQVKVLSAHRQPERLIKYIKQASRSRTKVFIAAAGRAAALPGVIAAHTSLPVIGIPIETKSLKGLDSLLSIVQMPAGVPVGCMAIGKSGARNAAIFALQILALNNQKIANKLLTFKRRLAGPVRRR
jgi:5-(carboxyamino)imidazole ribonucleotide mutase